MMRFIAIVLLWLCGWGIIIATAAWLLTNLPEDNPIRMAVVTYIEAEVGEFFVGLPLMIIGLVIIIPVMIWLWWNESL